MTLFRLSIVPGVFAAFLGMHSASAFEVDQDTGRQNGASRFVDPDDKIPYPHVADDGQPANFQAQPMGNSGVSINMAPSQGGSDAFQRAQDRMQQ